MGHTRNRSSSPKARTDKHRSRRSDQTAVAELPHQAEPISSDDFFKKSLEFKRWLKDEKNRYIDQLDSSKSKKYFEKFVKCWNRAQLDPDYYNPPTHWRTTSSASTSSHSWTFKGATTLDREKARAALHEASIGPTLPPQPLPSKSTIIGPSLPTTNLADFQYDLDQESEDKSRLNSQRKSELKRKWKNEKEEQDDGKATGKERLIEKRREKREIQIEYQRQKDDTNAPEIDDRNLFGSNNSFQEAVKARDRAHEKRTGKNSNFKIEKQIIMNEKLTAMKSKEDQTMAMFRAMANNKFGQPSSSS
ncbi:hypothetical protein MJO28_009558 [Puccinia striiformis f. sp. tritici]|uniref:Uncharacterized protein n=1 Tax=Puccinia striiformis f. sp. tritici TaxID=168172 RepID=A0ACC0E926_9BASI|nr:hypothetical protein MJO28_009558 [Puccinia striiformis f. sp. tritici]